MVRFLLRNQYGKRAKQKKQTMFEAMLAGLLTVAVLVAAWRISRRLDTRREDPYEGHERRR